MDESPATGLKVWRVLRWTLGVLGVLAVACLAAAGAAWGRYVRTDMRAMAVLDEVQSKPVPKLLRWGVANAVTIEELTLPSAAGPIAARLYVPAGRPNAPALVLLHGVHHLGMNEPRLVAFAHSLAAAGIRVLTPELPEIADYHVGTNSIATIGVAARWMAEHNVGTTELRKIQRMDGPGGKAYRPVGVMGLSFSGGLALLAAQDPAYHPYMSFVVAVGSHHAMVRVAAYYRTGTEEAPDGPDEELAPHEYGPLVLEYESLEDFVPQADVTPLRKVLRAHLYEDPAGEKAALAALTPDQQKEAAQLMDTKSEATRALLQANEERRADDMAAVSPFGHLADFSTPVYLLHGAGDNIIPAAETAWLVHELPPRVVAAVLITPVLSHLDMDGKQPTTMDYMNLVHFFGKILTATERE